MSPYNKNYVNLRKINAGKIVSTADNISATMHVCLCVHKTVVTSLSVCVHTPLSTSESWLTFNGAGF